MNNRSKLVASLVVLLLLLCGWLLWRNKVVPAPVVAAEPASANLGTAPSKTIPASLSPSNYPNGLPPKKDFVDPKVAKIEGIWAGQNTQVQDFYGNVIDQHGEPVAGATVNGDLMFIQGVDIGERKEVYKTETDVNGMFEFVGLHGWELAIAPSKSGYEFGRNTTALQLPIGGKTSSTNRAIFHMWKLQGAELMVKARIHAYIPCDGTPTLFDLTTGKRVATGGNLTVRLSRDPVDIVRGKPFNWQLTLEVSGGGVQEISDLYPNEAPADGYQPSVTVNMPVGTKNWSPDFQKSYYFTTGSGQDYGRISIDLTGDFQPPPTSFDADIYVNPAGSRNLEFDPFKQVH